MYLRRFRLFWDVRQDVRFYRLTVKIVMALLLCIPGGCGGADSYPRAKPVSSIGRTANCDHCSKEIAAVERTHLFEFQGVQYTVCCPECSDKLKDEIIHGGSHEH
ncbi:MAG: TRASH domain-containing protein [Planctomycetaceae bacterium]|nr:TRASH domain-containing protein [Planctomycetaceae bacterium]